MFIDTHAHLNFKAFDADLGDVIKRLNEAQVLRIINVGSNYQTSLKAIEIAENTKIVKSVKMFAAAGLHPIHLMNDITETEIIDNKEYKFTTKKEEFEYQKWLELAKSSDKIKAIGECGLDYFHKTYNIEHETLKKIQRDTFKKHIQLAKETKLPMILHCRGSETEPQAAYDEMLGILESYIIKPKTQNIAGVIHCFTGNLEQAKEFINLGFYIGVNGIVTFKKSYELQEIVKQLPLESIVLETDCPYLAPDPYRGKRNDPANIPIIAQKIAQLKNIELKEVEENTTKNAEDIFKL